MNKTSLILVGIVLAVLILLGVTFVTVGNGVIEKEEQINSAVGTIKVEEKRRFDLIPNLVEVVKQYADYESETFEKVIEMRTAASEGGNVDNAEKVFKVVAEAYPDLKANQQYQTLMLELATTENKIAEVRENYNKQVRTFNKYTRKFPNSMILGIKGYDNPNYKYMDFGAPSDAVNIKDEFNKK